MKHKILNYLIIIEPDERTGTGEAGYSVFCPVLGLADGGDTIEEAINNIEKLITFHLECLREEKRDTLNWLTTQENSIIAHARVKIPA